MANNSIKGFKVGNEVRKYDYNELDNLPENDPDDLAEEVNDLKSDLSEETENNYLAYNHNEINVNGVTVTSIGNGAFRIYGTATSNGGRNIKLTDVKTIPAGNYGLSVNTESGEQYIQVAVNDSANTLLFGTESFTSYNLAQDTSAYLGFIVNTAHGLYDDIVYITLDKSTEKQPFVPSITAKDSVARQLAETNRSSIDKISGFVNCAYTLEQGTISGTGAENSNANRIRTREYFPKKNIYATVNSSHYFWFAEYDEDKKFLRVVTATTSQLTESDFSSNCYYVRLIIVNLNHNTAILPTDDTGLNIAYNHLPDLIHEIDSELSINKKVNSRMEFGAHNGAENLAPECSIPAYRIAGQQGYEWAWIAGIWFSADGTMYVNHDATVDRTTNGTGTIANLTDSYINSLRLDIDEDGYDISDFSEEELIVPTFEDVLQQCIKYGMKMCIRVSDFPRIIQTESDQNKWNAFYNLLKAYNVKNEYVSFYVIYGGQANIVRQLFGDDAEISVYTGESTTPQQAIDWFTDNNIVGNRAFILHISKIDLDAIKLLHSNGIRVYTYGDKNVSISAVENLALWGNDIYQNATYYKLSE